METWIGDDGLTHWIEGGREHVAVAAHAHIDLDISYTLEGE